MISELEQQGKEVTFDEFLDAITSKLETKEGINKIFDLFDDDRSGTINLKNLQRVANDLGETMKLDEL
ncbi:UNVERIFIED_CONTAM: hypothetical protein GTU68_047618 [Idotea baltica]|nr:hypothetical protein [Idotea baltica]